MESEPITYDSVPKLTYLLEMSYDQAVEREAAGELHVSHTVEDVVVLHSGPSRKWREHNRPRVVSTNVLLKHIGDGVPIAGEAEEGDWPTHGENVIVMDRDGVQRSGVVIESPHTLLPAGHCAVRVGPNRG